MLCVEKIALCCESRTKLKHTVCAECGFSNVKILDVYSSKYRISEGQTFRFDQKENGHWVNICKQITQERCKTEVLLLYKSD